MHATLSDTKEAIIFGVPQGFVLGLIVFNIYINNIASVLQHLSISIYADDT